VSQLLTHGRVRRGYLGLAGQQRSLHRRWVRYYQLSGENVVEVVSIEPSAPAQKAGMRTGDYIVGVNGQAVASVDDLHRFLAEWPIGKSVNISVIRKKKRIELVVVPVEAKAH
jgi:S1-C subfamily serine protease